QFRTETYFRGRAPIASDWRLRKDAKLVLGPDDIGYRSVVISIAGDSGGQAKVTMRAASTGDTPQEDSFVLTAASPSATWIQRFAPGGAAPASSYRVEWQLPQGSVSLPWAESSSAALVLPNPFQKTLKFEFKADHALDDKTRILVNFRYQDAPH